MWLWNTALVEGPGATGEWAVELCAEEATGAITLTLHITGSTVSGPHSAELFFCLSATEQTRVTGQWARVKFAARHFRQRIGNLD